MRERWIHWKNSTPLWAYASDLGFTQNRSGSARDSGPSGWIAGVTYVSNCLGYARERRRLGGYVAPKLMWCDGVFLEPDEVCDGTFNEPES